MDTRNTSSFPVSALFLLALPFLAGSCGEAQAQTNEQLSAKVTELEQKITALEQRASVLEQKLQGAKLSWNTVFVRSESVDQTKAADAYCPSGKRLISGGCNCQGGATMEWSMPIRQSTCEEPGCLLGWTCSCAGGTEWAYAICGEPQLTFGGL